MLVYAHHTTTVAVAAFLSDVRTRCEQLPTRPSRAQLIDLLVDFGTVASGVIDALLPEVDDEHPAVAEWQHALGTISDAITADWCAEASGESPRAAGMQAVLAALARLAGVDGGAGPDTHLWRVPACVNVRMPEGFSCWAVLPEQYLAAADAYWRAQAPQRAFVLGLRSIGAPLAALVASLLRRRGVAVLERTARPRGDPFARHLSLAPALARAIADFAPTDIAIVDEGPGLSGSSFAGSIDAMRPFAVPGRRIAMFPSYRTDGQHLRDPRARAAWREHPIVVVPFESLVPAADAIDFSAGQWRPHVLGADDRVWPAVQPQHERRKYFHDDAGRTIRRFAGLGTVGHHKLARARILAEAGFGASPHGLANGFLREDWLDGRRLSATDAHVFTRRVADYVGFIRQRFTTGEAATLEPLRVLLHTNAVEALGAQAEPALQRLLTAHFSEPAVAIDGRMQPHEWVATSTGLKKTDAIDHHGDDFYPGCTDSAWDLAGAIVELDLDGEGEKQLLSRYISQTRDVTVTRRLRFYRAAYLAFRLGYVTLAADTLGDHDRDGRAFRQAAARYRRSLAELLARPR